MRAVVVAFIVVGIALLGKMLWPAETSLSPQDSLFSVQTMWSEARPCHQEVRVRGSALSLRTVTLRSAVDGHVVALPFSRGARVQAGDVLVQLALDERPAKVTEAKAALQHRDLSYITEYALSRKDFRSDKQLAEAKSALEKARAELDVAVRRLRDTTITAPFQGVWDDHQVEVGDYVMPGQAVGTLVDLSTLRVILHVRESLYPLVKAGMQALVRFGDGAVRPGVVQHVHVVADDVTRTYPVEVWVTNADMSVPAGMTAEVILRLDAQEAHYISPSLITLDEKGIMNVQTVDPSTHKVSTYPVRILSTDRRGFWLEGLPPRVQLITVGQDFVSPGDKVNPVLVPAKCSDRPVGMMAVACEGDNQDHNSQSPPVEAIGAQGHQDLPVLCDPEGGSKDCSSQDSPKDDRGDVQTSDSSLSGSTAPDAPVTGMAVADPSSASQEKP